MDAILLLAVIEDVRRTLLDGVVRAVVPAGAAGLWFELVTPRGVDGLLAAADDPFPRLSPGAARPPKSRALPALAGVARRLLPGTRLSAVRHQGLDRTVTLVFSPTVSASGPDGDPLTECHLVLELFGRHPNLALLDPVTGRILEVARRTPEAVEPVRAPGAPFAPQRSVARPDPRLLGTVEAIAGVLEPPRAAGLPPGLVLRQSLSGLSDLWAHEVLGRAGDEAAAALARALFDLIRDVEAGPWEPRLVLDAAGSPVAASPVRLQHLPDDRQPPCASLGEAVERLARHLAGRQALDGEKGALRQILRRLDGRLRSRRVKLVAEVEEFSRADLYQRMGEVLVAHQGQVVRGAREVSLPDHASGTEATITIPLDPTLAPAGNAERFFRLARRGRRGAMRVATRLAETDRELTRVQAWAERLAAMDGREGLADIRKELEGMPRLLSPADRAILAAAGADEAPARAPQARREQPGARAARGDRKQGPEPRRFASSDGLPILVGRDNEGNDYLTVHLARSEDLWLHVQGFSGSHVVVRVLDRKSGVPRRTLIEAAQLAAYYSQARSHGKVEVSYTLKKYVRKPRKSPPGLVTITQEKTVTVKPDKSLVAKLAQGIDDFRLPIAECRRHT